MKKLAFVIVCGWLLIGESVLAEGFTLFSSDVSGQLSEAQVFSGFGCNGKNISPQLKWENAPEGTRSFAVTVYDPDAPSGSGWWHWLIFDIPKNVTSLKAGAGNIESGLAPKGAVQSVTSFGVAGYGGACPPQGDSAHRYLFTVYALKVDKLELDSNAMPALVGFMLNRNALAKASLIAYYAR